MVQQPQGGQSLVMSFLTLRKVIGILGVALPFVVSIAAWLLFGTRVQNSISRYYYTGMRDVLVGTLWAIGFFLLSYKGYDRADDIASNCACIFAVGVSLFPTNPRAQVTGVVFLDGKLHFAFAALFFATLIYISAFQFTKTDPAKLPTPRKLERNLVYRGCAVAMGLCMLLISIYYLLPADTASQIDPVNPIYWLESVAIVAFGVSWLTKGEAILKDEVEPFMV